MRNVGRGLIAVFAILLCLGGLEKLARAEDVQDIFLSDFIVRLTKAIEANDKDAFAGLFDGQAKVDGQLLDAEKYSKLFDDLADIHKNMIITRFLRKI